MKSTRQKTFIAGFLLCGLLADCGSLFAGQKIQPMMNGSELGRDLSTNESLLMQFQNEREALLRDKSKDSAPHLLKNKLKILDAKITFLKSELKRARPIKVQKAVSVAAAPQIAPLAPKKPMQQAKQVKPIKKIHLPLAVSMRPYAKPEPRHRIFLAMVRKAVEPQPMQKPSLRQPSAALPLPKKVLMQPSLALAGRENPMARAESKKVELPLSAHVQPIQAVKAPPAAARPALVPGQKTAKTGSDWKSMTKAEKDIYVLSVMGNLGRRDVFLEKSYGFYIREIDDQLRQNPSLENEFVHKLLIASAYKNEPELRKDLDKLGK